MPAYLKNLKVPAGYQNTGEIGRRQRGELDPDRQATLQLRDQVGRLSACITIACERAADGDLLAGLGDRVAGAERTAEIAHEQEVAILVRYCCRMSVIRSQRNNRLLPLARRDVRSRHAANLLLN